MFSVGFKIRESSNLFRSLSRRSVIILYDKKNPKSPIQIAFDMPLCPSFNLVIVGSTLLVSASSIITSWIKTAVWNISKAVARGR